MFKNCLENTCFQKNLHFQTKENYHQVIIIGAGAAGIGAALTLSKSGLPYLVLQARQRIGGRIFSQRVSDKEVDLGASWVHSYSKSNPMYNEIKRLNWKARKALPFTDQITFSELKGKVSDQDYQHAQKIFKTYYDKFTKNAQNQDEDISIEQAGREFYKSKIATLDPFKKSLVDLLINEIENLEASQIQKISAQNYEDQQEIEGNDWLPEHSYSRLLNAIAQSFQFSKNVKFNIEVSEIVYAEQNGYCKIITKDKQVFYAKKIISSLPLGILKSNKVKFTPPLEKKYQECIDKLGWGVMNKVIVSLEKPFWKGNPDWISIACQQRGKFPLIYNLSFENKYILICFLTDKFAYKMSQKSDNEIISEFVELLKKSTHQQDIKVIDYKITRWNKDPYSLGSYSHFGVGSSMRTSRRLRTNINEKLWMVGQHCYGEHIGCAHGAFQTGIWAAQQVSKLIKKG